MNIREAELLKYLVKCVTQNCWCSAIAGIAIGSNIERIVSEITVFVQWNIFVIAFMVALLMFQIYCIPTDVQDAVKKAAKESQEDAEKE